MDNPEYTFQILEVFSKIKTKEIPRELEEYISYVARTGDPVFQWPLVKILIKEKLLAVLNEFKESNPSLEIPPCPNVEPFHYETMKNNLLTRLDSFILPPFTIQRICELLSAPRKEYNRIDKYMRAVEKNVLVVSACELSLKPGLEADGNESMMNGMLYGKVNDSLSNFTNHVFSTSHESNVDELHLSGKLDVPENDAVQQILNESWTEGGDNEEFKINQSSNSSLSVNFDNELQFVTEKSPDKINATESESKNADEGTSFADNDLLIDSNLQNMIVESTSNYDDASKSSDSSESSSADIATENKTDMIFAFSNENSQSDIDTSENTSQSDTESSQPADADSKCDDENTSEVETNSISDDKEYSQEILNDGDTLEKPSQSDQYKNEQIFGYEDFSEIATKNETLKYNFDTEPKGEDTSEYSDKKPEDENATDRNESLTLFETSDESCDQIDGADLENKTEKTDQTFSCGDTEITQTPSECTKETDLIPGIHGEPESTVDTEISSSEKYDFVISDSDL